MTRKIAWIGSKARWVQETDTEGQPLYDVDTGKPVLTVDMEWEKKREIVIPGVSWRVITANNPEIPGMSQTYVWGVAGTPPDDWLDRLDLDDEYERYNVQGGGPETFVVDMTEEDWNTLSQNEEFGGYFRDVTDDPDWIKRHFRPIRELLREA